MYTRTFPFSAADDEMSNVDRISQLPDPILHKILSSLPRTREAVRTSILSRRWANLWLSVSNLRLRTSDFGKKPLSNPTHTERFHLFLRKILLHLDSSNIQMQTLQLAWSRGYEFDGSLLAESLRVAVRRNVQQLDLSFPSFTKMLPCVLTCQSVVTLRLEACRIDAGAMDTVCLGRLTTLELVSVDTEGVSVEKLISGCPALQQLTMHYCGVTGDLDISSPTLQTLNLIGHYMWRTCLLSVSAPALQSFKLVGLLARNFTVRNSSSIASLHIVSSARYPIDSWTRTILEFLHNVHDLELSTIELKLLFDEIVALEPLPTFPRLKTLKLNTNLSVGPIQAMTCIFQCFPSLEKLVIKKCEGFSFCRKSCVLKESSEIFLGNLKFVKFHGFPCADGEQSPKRFINFFLSTAKDLEKKLLEKLFELM